MAGRTLTLATVLLTGALALTGCGLLTKKTTAPAAPPVVAAASPSASASSDSGSAETSVPDPCTLITDNDVSVAVGKPVAKHFPGTNGPILSCEWTLDPAFLVVRITLTRTTREAFDSAQKLDPPSKPVTDVGDAAYVGGDQDLRVLKGTFLMTLKYSDTAHPESQLAANKTVAAKVLPKLT
ncbi:DUF3558 family protein [Fodinicola feengrottensis]|uniref:DUF3558 family protein n=1 Tax=Fodinicola feengrottensis TaxID=435914 RepID=UPI0013D07119|nr:DUF3558 family protein [Fodinicola feengrottensis]